MSGRYPCLKWLHAIPNGGKRGKREAVILKREGVTAGIPDLFLPYPIHSESGQIVSAGLYIEVKAGKDSLRPAQRSFRDYATKAGYKYIVVKSAQSGIDSILEYLEGDL